MTSIESGTMNLAVPYLSQKDHASSFKYGSKACGLTSLRMVLGYYGYPLDFEAVNALATQTGAYDEDKGWIHAGLVNMARDLGLRGFRINYEFLADENIELARPALAREGAKLEEIDQFTASVINARSKGAIAALDELLDKKVPIIASMSRDYAKTSATHLVVIKGSEADKFIVNDPWDFGEDYQIAKTDFESKWTKRAVVIYSELGK